MRAHVYHLSVQMFRIWPAIEWTLRSQIFLLGDNVSSVSRVVSEVATCELGSDCFVSELMSSLSLSKKSEALLYVCSVFSWNVATSITKRETHRCQWHWFLHSNPDLWEPANQKTALVWIDQSETSFECTTNQRLVLHWINQSELSIYLTNPWSLWSRTSWWSAGSRWWSYCCVRHGDTVPPSHSQQLYLKQQECK